MTKDDFCCVVPFNDPANDDKNIADDYKNIADNYNLRTDY
jgi:hypothetical protein